MTITEDKVDKLFSENLGDVAVTPEQLKSLRPKPFELVWVRKNDKWESDRNAPRWKLVVQTNFEPPVWCLRISTGYFR